MGLTFLQKDSNCPHISHRSRRFLPYLSLKMAISLLENSLSIFSAYSKNCGLKRIVPFTKNHHSPGLQTLTTNTIDYSNGIQKKITENCSRMTQPDNCTTSLTKHFFKFLIRCAAVVCLFAERTIQQNYTDALTLSPFLVCACCSKFVEYIEIIIATKHDRLMYQHSRMKTEHR